MTLQVTGKNIDVGDALRAYVVERIEHTLDKYVGSSLSGHVWIEKERGAFRTDCSISLRTGLTLQSHGEAADAYASADLALERLDKRLRRYKRRLKRRHGTSAAPEKQVEAPNYVIETAGESEDVPEGDNPVIIAETQMVIRELPVSDAVMQMDLLDEGFMVFRNASHGRINVVYRRPDGNIGWIDPGGEPAQK
jgi:ribosomal subunit interface protein